VVAFFPAFLSALLSGDPSLAAPAPKPLPKKVFVVYVTVVEVDAEGNETVLLTPKVQTTGSLAGATVQLNEGRLFEFRCEFINSIAENSKLPKLAKVTGNSATNAPATIPAAVTKTAAPKIDEYLFRTYDVSELMEFERELTAEDFEPLIQTLKTIASPESWQGKATIRPFVSTKSLVIKQTAAVHKEVAEALKELSPKKQAKD
jgi:hypothetical protein